MPDLVVRASGPLHGSVVVPGDKSISHRALLLGALATGDTRVRGWLPAMDCQATLHIVRALGVAVDQITETELIVHGVGLDGLKEPGDVLDCRGSGTTMRLLAGLLAGCGFLSILTGTEALRRRPMDRISIPLRMMGATVLGRGGDRLPPLAIRGGALRSIQYDMPVASAQVKSAILLASLFADGETVIREPGPARDHTERMLRSFGAQVRVDGPVIRFLGCQRLRGQGAGEGDVGLDVPADLSSAAFPLVAALLVAGSDVTVKQVGTNPTRTGLLDLLAEMGSPVQQNHPAGTGQAALEDGEPMADLSAHPGELRGIAVGGEVVVRAIDEFPIFAVAATQANGTTTIRDAAELRVKEADRIATIAAELGKMGAQIEERADGMVVHGPCKLRGAHVESHHDHRLAMSLAVAGLIAQGATVIHGSTTIEDSFPGFVETMQALGADVVWR